MTMQEFELLCGLNAARITSENWSVDQSAIICEACAEFIDKTEEGFLDNFNLYVKN